MNKLKKCKTCGDPFQWDSKLVSLDNGYHHVDCLETSTKEVTMFFDSHENYLSDSEDNQMCQAYEILMSDEYIDCD